MGRTGCRLHNSGIFFHKFEDIMKREKVEDEREGTDSWGTPLIPGAGMWAHFQKHCWINVFCTDVSSMMNSRHLLWSDVPLISAGDMHIEQRRWAWILFKTTRHKRAEEVSRRLVQSWTPVFLKHAALQSHPGPLDGPTLPALHLVLFPYRLVVFSAARWKVPTLEHFSQGCWMHGFLQENRRSKCTKRTMD